MNFESAYKRVGELIDKFEANEAFFCAPTYLESKARAEFIDEFFIALGWDVRSLHNTNPYELEVDIEKSQTQEDSFSKKRADYAFYKAPNFKQECFFVEAKKPSRLLNKNKEDYFQTAKYGYNSATGISILTDFQEFVVLDCRFKPDKDTILSTQIEYFNYKQFRDKTIFGKVFWLFSKEAVQGGKLQTYLENLPIPKKAGKTRQLKLNFGTYKAIDHDFLEFIETIRKDIAVAVYHSQPSLKNYELTETVQKILDRLVFIRFLEDKSIENDSVIEAIYNSPYPWAKYVEECKRLNAKYNGIVFKEAFFDNADFLAKDNKPFKDIVFEFSANESPYNFNYIPIEIIGNIYERFLGKTIEIIDKKVNIDFKPLERKAGGVFYTPTYIVEYIVKNTVGKLIEGKEPKEIAKMSFADISCGSGSFLIGVYDFLLQYHTRYYNENPDQAKKDKCGYNTENRIYYLTLNQKKQILLNNIYGVDIDSQATEVAQLSLFLKLLENENLFSTDKLDMFGSDKILPNLTNNIKCGNTLIGNDFYAQTQLNLYNEDEQRKINVFDFEPSFPKVFQNGGFDAIVGNPPYVSIRSITEFTTNEVKEYFSLKYKTAFKGYDLYILFFERALLKLKMNGILGYITPNKFATLDYALNFRKLVLKDYCFIEITDLSNLNVFETASVYPYISIIGKIEKDNNHSILTKKCTVQSDLYDKDFISIPQNIYLKNENYNISLNNENLKLAQTISLEKVCKVQAGTTGFLATITKDCIVDNSKNGLDFIVTGSIDRYEINLGNVRYMNKKFELPKLFNKNNLITEGKWSLFCSPKIVIGGMTKQIEAAYDSIGVAVGVGVYCLTEIVINEILLLSILNSKIVSYLFRKEFEAKHLAGGYLAINAGQLKQIPIPIDIPKEKETELIRYVDTIMELKKQLHITLADSSKERLQNQINSIEFSIDRLVYSLYDLSSEDIEVIESSLAKKD